MRLGRSLETGGSWTVGLGTEAENVGASLCPRVTRVNSRGHVRETELRMPGLFILFPHPLPQMGDLQ